MRIQHTDRYIKMAKRVKETEKDVVVTLKRDPVREAVEGQFHKQEKDALLEQTKQYWKDLDEIYNATAQSIIMSGKTIRDLLSIEGIKERLNERHEMVIAVNGFIKDLDTFSTALKSVHDKHAHKTGLISETDFILSIEIFEEYRALSVQFDSVVMPNIVYISTEIGYTADALLAERAKLKEETPIETTSEDTV